MKKIANTIQDKETNELLCRLYEDCMKFKRENGKKINCNNYSVIDNNAATEKKLLDRQILFFI